jgi:hypothetical protein
MEEEYGRWENFKNKVSRSYNQAFGNYYSILPCNLRPYATILPVVGVAAAGLIVGCAAGAADNSSVIVSGHVKDLSTGSVADYFMNNTSMSTHISPDFPRHSGEIILSNAYPKPGMAASFGEILKNATNNLPTLEQIKSKALHP